MTTDTKIRGTEKLFIACNHASQTSQKIDGPMSAVMSKDKTYATSEEARKDGNNLVLARNFQQGRNLQNSAPIALNCTALQAYQRASELDPDEWRPVATSMEPVCSLLRAR